MQIAGKDMDKTSRFLGMKPSLVKDASNNL